MSDQGKKGYPALKHAGYSATTILPGESAAEFERLHQNLMTELNPNGALEDDIVATMAHYIWRKKNLVTLRLAEHARARYAQIRAEIIPQSELGYSFMTLGPVKPVDPAVLKEATQTAEEQARKELGEAYELVQVGSTATVDQLMRELEIQERLDAMIDKCVKRLLLLRGLKSISIDAKSASPARMTARSEAA
jgi:hypothetical protein